MTAFEVPTGSNVSITSGSVCMNFLKTATLEEVWQNVTFTATATDQFQVDNHGVLRRLFVDTSIRMPNGDHTIWLSNTIHRPDSNGTHSSVALPELPAPVLPQAQPLAPGLSTIPESADREQA